MVQNTLLWGTTALGGVAAQLAGHQESVLDMVLGSGLVVRVVLIILLAFSVGCWGIALAKSLEMRRARRQSERFVEIFWDAKNLSAIQAASVNLKESPVAQVFRGGYQELQRVNKAKRNNPGEDESTELGGTVNVQRAIVRARTQEVTRLERGLTFLATTASTAPFIGLFGTVWGIMTAFRGLSTTTSSSIQAVAPGIAEALIATAVGLAAAIPAVVMYNRFARQVRVLTAEMDTFASEFLNIAERHFLK
ncbi:MAG TPA: protein TolQ [Candidatus Binatus sp.]|jgi:biopolymer transport protein TolQ|nr:protein TolQ [Candidatus Binatus sp.]